MVTERRASSGLMKTQKLGAPATSLFAGTSGLGEPSQGPNKWEVGVGKTTEPPGSASLEAQDANAFFIIQAEDSRSSEEEALCQQRLGAPFMNMQPPTAAYEGDGEVTRTRKFSTGALLPMTLQPGLCSEGEGKLLGPCQKLGDRGSKVFFLPGRRALSSDPDRARPRAVLGAAAELWALARAGQL
ncbi:hypothetical protein CapIbe_013872 [Capra ibex]